LSGITEVQRKTGRWWTLVGGLVLLCLGIQLVPVVRSNPPVTSEVWVPQNLRAALRTSCYSCHSNETVWPWYSRVAPISWAVARDVRLGRSKLNFSEWPAQNSDEEAFLLELIGGQLRNRLMPLRRFTLIHPEARLTDAQYDALLEWFKPSPAFDWLSTDGLGS
jgi:Haem-binding domain